MALKTNFPTINSWTMQSSLWGGVWVVIAISSLDYSNTSFAERCSVIHFHLNKNAEIPRRLLIRTQKSY